MAVVPQMDEGERKRRVRRTALVLAAIVIAIYVAFVAYGITRH